MTVGNEQIDVAVVVVIEKPQAPAAHRSSRVPDPVRRREIVEGAVLVVVIDGVHLLIHIGHAQVLPTVLVEVCGIDTHPGPGPAVSTVSDSRLDPLVLELALTIHPQKIGDGIVGDKEVHPAVIIDVGGHRTPGLAQARADPGGCGDVGKCAVPVVVKQPAVAWVDRCGECSSGAPRCPHCHRICWPPCRIRRIGRRTDRGDRHCRSRTRRRWRPIPAWRYPT